MIGFLRCIASTVLFVSSLLGLGLAGGIEKGARIATNAPALLICLALFAVSVLIINLTEERETEC